MVAIPLGVGAYEREYAGEPAIRLVNRFLEQNPTNQREGIALLSRPGTNELAYFSGGAIRRCFMKLGMFDNDLFVVSGENLYRYTSAGVKTQITGVIEGTGFPAFAWMKGFDYERLFVADGLLLQYYQGGTHATGTLTDSGTITSQVIEIGGVYYTWSASVDGGTPAGTSANPWRALLGGTDADSLENMAQAINFDGVRGTDFSTLLGGPHPTVRAAATATTLVATALSEYAAGNAITSTVFSGAGLAWGGATLSGGGTHALAGVPVPDGLGIRSLASLASHVLASVADSQRFYFIRPGEVVIDPLDFFSKEKSPDNIIDMHRVGDQVTIFGDGSTESWYATGNSDVPFASVEGRVFERGVVEGTPVVIQDYVVFVGDNGIVYTTEGGAVQRISNHGIEERVRKLLRSEQGLTA